MTINEALERFTTQLQADGRSPHTIAQYRRHVRLFAHWCADVGACGDDIGQVGHEAVAEFLAADAATLRPDGERKKATAMNCLRTSLKGFFSYLHRAGYIRQDPSRLVRRAVCSPPPPKCLSPEEQARLMATLAAGGGPEAERDHALFHLMLASGIRLGSAVALDVEDIDLGGREVVLRRTKGDRPERVLLGEEIAAHLGRYLEGRSSGALFTARGKRVSVRHAQRRFSMWVGKAGITRRVTCHSLRHSFGQRVYDKTKDVLLAKEALRHRSISSTLVYARADRARLRLALA